MTKTQKGRKKKEARRKRDKLRAMQKQQKMHATARRVAKLLIYGPPTTEYRYYQYRDLTKPPQRVGQI